MLVPVGWAKSRPAYNHRTGIASRLIHGAGSYPLGPSSRARRSASGIVVLETRPA